MFCVFDPDPLLSLYSVPFPLCLPLVVFSLETFTCGSVYMIEKMDFNVSKYLLLTIRLRWLGLRLKL